MSSKRSSSGNKVHQRVLGMVNAAEQGRYVKQYDMPREIKKVERKVTKTGVKDLLDKFQKKATRKVSPARGSSGRQSRSSGRRRAARGPLVTADVGFGDEKNSALSKSKKGRTATAAAKKVRNAFSYAANSIANLAKGHIHPPKGGNKNKRNNKNQKR